MATRANPQGESTLDGLRGRMRSEERRMESQHERLDSLCRELYSRLDKGGAAGAIGEFVGFIAALDAHMKVEEEIFFPMLYGLRADLGLQLEALVAQHAEFRIDAAEIQARLRAHDSEGARFGLDRLARRILEHEQVEEDLLARITEGPMAEVGHSGHWD